MLKIMRKDWEALRRHGEETYPYECCGVLLGHVDPDSAGGTNQVRGLVPCSNTRTDSPQNRYSIDPRELVRAQRNARARDTDIIGFYHSHPDHPARWSQTDLEDAHWLGCSYVITSVEQGRARDTNSFRLVGPDEEQKRFEDEPVAIIEPPE